VTGARFVAFVARLRRQVGGISTMEFALGMPLLLGFGGYGVEMSNLAITNMRISQYALQVADNASRIGVNSGLATFQLREGDINDVIQGLRLFSAGSHLTQFGRVTISSLENIQQSYADGNGNDTAPVQRIHWQRCIGQRGGDADPGFDSSYGTTNVNAASPASGDLPTQANAGTDKPGGMGETGQEINAPEGMGVIFVEVNYQYQPLFGTLFVNPTKLHYTASVIVRDKRDFRQIYNPSPTAVASTCDRHTA